MSIFETLSSIKVSYKIIFLTEKTSGFTIRLVRLSEKLMKVTGSQGIMKLVSIHLDWQAGFTSIQ
jgi:hypothetical protein